MTPDRKSQQRIGHICAHTLIFMRAGCLIVACGDVFIQASDQAIVSLKIVSVDASVLF
jgi:hypothetical protein